MGRALSSWQKKPDRTQARRRVLFYDEIPTWQKDNEHLLYGYRPTSGSWFRSLRSVLEWHNESINIHSHLIGAKTFAALPFHFYSSVNNRIDGIYTPDVIFFHVYFLGVAVCFACSACCHVIWNHSAAVALFGNRIDCSGIVLLMWSASLLSIHFGFICDPMWKYLHWSLVSVSACGCIGFTLNPRFYGPAFRDHRALMYTCFGLSGITFISHGIFKYGFSLQRRRLGLEWMALMGLLNITGAMFYASRLPERRFPYRFDFIGASHQIFHVLVVAAGLVHYEALIQELSEVRESPILVKCVGYMQRPPKSSHRRCSIALAVWREMSSSSRKDS